MQIHTDQFLQLPASVVTIGALDGVHLGHQTLILRARERAERLCVPLVVYTFDPPPRVYFNNTMLLTPLKEKQRRLKLLGVDHVVTATFNAEYIAREPDSFLEELSDLNPIEIWIGQDFRFGKNRVGHIDMLRDYFSVQVLDPVCCTAGKIISSSRIRP